MKPIHRLFYPPAWSIAAKVSAALLSAALIPMSFNTYYNLRRGLERVEASEYRKLELLATSAATRLDQLIIDFQSIAAQVATENNVVNFLAATTPKQRAAFKPSIQATLFNVFRSNSDYDAVYLMDTQGKCLASTDPSFIGKNYSFREYFRQAIGGNPYVSSILMGKTTQRAGLYLSHPVRNRDKIVGVAVIKIKEEDIAAVVNSLDLDPKSYAFLVDRIGVVISHPDKSVLYHSLADLSPETQKQIRIDQRYHLERIESLKLTKLAAAMIGASETGHVNYYSPREEQNQRVGFAPLEIVPWVLGVNKPETLFVAPLRYLIWQNSSSLLAVGAIASIVAIILARSIAKPIRELTLAAEDIERGHFKDNRLIQFAKGRDDIGQLVKVFITMAHQVEMREQKLKNQVVELNFEIDEAKKERQVAAVTGTEYFQQLQQKANRLRKRSPINNNEAEYYRHLQQKAQEFKSQNLKVKTQK